MTSNHLASELIERFGVQQLPRAERKIVYKHLLQCETCRRRIVDSRREAAGLLALAAQLLPEKALKPDHVNYPVVENYVENKLSNADKEIVRSHLEVCRACSAEVDDLTESLIVMRNRAEAGRYISDSQTGWRRVMQGISVRYVTVAVLGVLLITILSVVIWLELSKRSAQPQIGHESVQPRPSREFNEQMTPNSGGLRVEAPSKRELIALNDGDRRVIVTSKGDLEGLGRISNSDQRDITRLLLTGRLKKPDILETLQTNRITLRGETDTKTTITIVSPRGGVTLEDPPTFKWLSVEGARYYQVLVGDEDFHEVADSGMIDVRNTEWKPQQGLERRIVYTWVVKAAIGSADASDSIVASPSAKFTILSKEKIVKLSHLKATKRSHLELGMFYVREGLIDLAEREFTILSHQNPHSGTLKRILASMRSWK